MAFRFATLQETLGGTIHVNPHEVAYVNEEGGYTQIHFTSGEKKPVNGTLDDAVDAIKKAAH